MMNQIPPVVKNLLIINALIYFATIQLGGDLSITRNAKNHILYEYLSLWNIHQGFSPYQIITYMFMHADFSHLLFNMLPLFIFGKTLENVWGSKRFLTFYILTGVGAGITQLIVGDFTLTVGASGAIFGILIGFATLFPNAQLLLLIPPMPIKAKYFVGIYILIELFAGIYTVGSGIAHFAHLGGALSGWLALKYWKIDKNQLY